MLHTVYDELPSLDKFCHIACGYATSLSYNGHTIMSEEGAQQGTPWTVTVLYDHSVTAAIG